MQKGLKNGMKKEQFNTRIPAPLRRAVAAVAGALDLTNEQMAEIALATLLGSEDAAVQSRQKKIEQTAKRMRLSFDEPQLQLAGVLN